MWKKKFFFPSSEKEGRKRILFLWEAGKRNELFPWFLILFNKNKDCYRNRVEFS